MSTLGLAFRFCRKCEVCSCPSFLSLGSATRQREHRQLYERSETQMRQRNAGARKIQNIFFTFPVARELIEIAFACSYGRGRNNCVGVRRIGCWYSAATRGMSKTSGKTRNETQTHSPMVANYEELIVARVGSMIAFVELKETEALTCERSRCDRAQRYDT
jgi:hypothetical protein